jgi:mycofactocin precursor
LISKFFNPAVGDDDSDHSTAARNINPEILTQEKKGKKRKKMTENNEKKTCETCQEEENIQEIFETEEVEIEEMAIDGICGVY